MFSIQLSWKEFNLNLTAVETWMRANAGDKYTGNSADVALTLWFTEEPAQEVKDAVQGYWTAITAESTEATSYKSQAQIIEQIATLKNGLIAKSWDQMSAVERKLMLGLNVTTTELFA